jgi:hypothetical protein
MDQDTFLMTVPSKFDDWLKTQRDFVDRPNSGYH